MVHGRWYHERAIRARDSANARPSGEAPVRTQRCGSHHDPERERRSLGTIGIRRGANRELVRIPVFCLPYPDPLNSLHLNLIEHLVKALIYLIQEKLLMTAELGNCSRHDSQH
jgi:hypothetical protein